ncbi:hypothetical protein HNQ51_001966 [Inhella inkyongensis]|uniref:Ice-binding protein C-terminal domain-containing protein n=1 Tax=Inhella inkyongensis TaxID=392593 RepID=A0A840S519_9BURK|nr:PEP-CTERM sorting domain-containing protein [Inhella inkyongensis]MBB5204652.1 hypothetical protein [Inhella inkyongensis]
MKIRLLALAAFASMSLSAQAVEVVALWDFNSGTTKHTQSANGASFATVGGVTTTFAAGLSSTQALNTATYAANGANQSMGVQFMIDTTGYTDLSFSFSQRNSNTASAYSALKYTLDGTTWITATTLLTPAGTGFTSHSFSFASIVGANNNANFGIQLVASYAPGGSAYQATAAGSSFGASGTIRYENVTLSGTAIPAVPEPQTYALMLAGLGVVTTVARRRRSA